MLLLTAFAMLWAPVPHAPPRAHATVRIVRAAKAAQGEWEKLPPSGRREIIVVEGGRRLKLRVIEIE